MPARIDHKFEDGRELKWCSKCKQWLDLDRFGTTGIKNRTWDGLFYACAQCLNESRRNNPRRKALSAWCAIMRRVKREDYQTKGIKLKMDKESFVQWYVANWFRGCLVDRIDNNGHYQLDNIQLLSITEHNRKARQDRLDSLGIIEPNDKRYCYGCRLFRDYSDFRSRAVDGEIRWIERCKQCEAAQIRQKRQREKLERKSS